MPLRSYLPSRTLISTALSTTRPSLASPVNSIPARSTSSCSASLSAGAGSFTISATRTASRAVPSAKGFYVACKKQGLAGWCADPRPTVSWPTNSRAHYLSANSQISLTPRSLLVRGSNRNPHLLFIPTCIEKKLHCLLSGWHRSHFYDQMQQNRGIFNTFHLFLRLALHLWKTCPNDVQ